VLLECYKSVIKVLLECYKSVIKVLQKCYKSVTRVFQAELSLASKFWEISPIREFSDNIIEFLCYFQNWSKTPQNASKCYRNVEKAPEIVQNFYIYVQSNQKISRKAPEL
jgi:hypothetical protein